MISFRWICLSSLLIVVFSGYLSKAEEVPTFSQCKVHIEAAIKDKDLLLPEEENEIDLGTSNENGEEIADGSEPVEAIESDRKENSAEDNEQVERETEEGETVNDEATGKVYDKNEGLDSDNALDDPKDVVGVESHSGNQYKGEESNDSRFEMLVDEGEDELGEEIDGNSNETEEEEVENSSMVDENGENNVEEEAGQDEDLDPTELEDNVNQAYEEAKQNSQEEEDDEEEEMGVIQDTEGFEDGATKTEEFEAEEEIKATAEAQVEEEDKFERLEPQSEQVTDSTVDNSDSDSIETQPIEASNNAVEVANEAVNESEPQENENPKEVEAQAQPQKAVPAHANQKQSNEHKTTKSVLTEEVQEATVPLPPIETTPIQPEAVTIEESIVEEAVPFEGIIEEEPPVRRPRDHIDEFLRLGEGAENLALKKNAIQVTLREVKKVVETAVRPLEAIYKYKDISNRHFGDNEIFSKPLVLFLGPWSGGKSSIINYLLGIEFTENALKSGAEPSANYFQVMVHGDEEEQIDGTQLAADFTFAGLQKFGQAFIDRLRGKRLPNKLLQKANIVEIPGILEMRREVDRPYPFNDVVQWFVDRADLIFVVYDPTKLDMGLEHEALFDQLKGRQNQVRVLLNKADTVSQEELLLIQNNLMWQLSPLLASPLPPVVYAGSFWSKPYNIESPRRLLAAHEENMLNDIREAVDNIVENTIAEARRHAVRVRNHAKMVDCYLTTFFNHKGYFGNKEKVMDDIIENPHKYHIFEGLSTLTNISRYDLPDSDVYRDFFKVHKLYEFQNLASTCSFFRGCPIDKLDVAISYELPELIGKYKKRLQSINGKTKSKGT
ncbi:sarcalumenin-like [Artemia franciscana]|uniref:sarcalumenin-like n=1 Tax=Artemia franciscana TaxID=6661 RepID=UPI0032DBAF0C